MRWKAEAEAKAKEAEERAKEKATEQAEKAGLSTTGSDWSALCN